MTQTDRTPARRRGTFGLLALLLVAFALRTTDLALQNIWWDEARNIDVALRPFWQIPTAPELDIHPPLYFWLLHGWLGLAGVERGAAWEITAFLSRYLSVAAGLLSVALLYQLTRRSATAQAGLLAALLATLSPFWLAESQEARMYTLGFAFLLAAALVGRREIGRSEIGDWRANLQSPISNLPISFPLLSAAALLIHYNAAFVLAAWYLWWAFAALLGPRRWEKLRRLILSGLLTGLILLPVVPIALRQIPGYANPNLTVPTPGQYLWENWLGYLGGYAWQSDSLAWLRSGEWWLWAVAGSGVLGIGYWVVGWRRANIRYPIPNSQSLFLPVWLLGGLALYYIAVVDRGAFNIRYASFVTPALYALLGIGLAGLGRWQRRLPAAGALLLLVGLLPAARADLTDARFFREDTASLAAWLGAETGPDDAILVDQKYPFGFYWPGYAIEPEEQPAGADAPARYLFVDINRIDQRLTDWAGQARRIYWVVWYESDTDPRGAVPFLLDKYGTFQGEQLFRGYRVGWWQMTPPTRFVLAEGMQPQRHRWRGGLESVEIGLPTRTYRPGDGLPVVIRWQRPAGEIHRPLKARVALYSSDGGRLAQNDRPLLNDRHLAPGEWDATDQPLNVYTLPLPVELAPGRYALRLLVYDAETLEAVELLDDAGNPAGFEPEIGGVEIGE